MKKFVDSGEHFVLSSFQIKRIPMLQKETLPEVSPAQTLFEDACYLSSEGTGQTAIELLRIAGPRRGKEIQHIVTLRTHAPAEGECVLRQEALIRGMLSLLHRAGYLVEEIAYEEYRQACKKVPDQAVWAMKKQTLHDHGIHGEYVSVPVLESVDWKSIYAVLDGSGCCMCVQIIPSLLSEAERKTVLRHHAACAQAADGVVPNLRDPSAVPAEKRWQYYLDRAVKPAADVTFFLSGEPVNTALAVARVRQALGEVPLESFPVEGHRNISVYNQPWKLAALTKRHHPAEFGKWSTEEAALLFQFPYQDDYFVGIRENPFSLTPETALLPESMTDPKSPGLCLGVSVFSGQKIFLPYDQFLLHTAAMGKSGAGKTTFLKQLLKQFHRAKIPVLILEPVKREYRDVVAGFSGGKIFTVEKPVVPLLLNPFQVPGGVTLGEYRSCLLSVFKAAFSLPDPLPALFEKAISEAYTQYGWTDRNQSSDQGIRLFDMADFIRVFKRVIAASSYSGEVKGNMMSGGAFRLQSLIERCPRTFDTLHSTDVRDLLDGCAVIEMGNLEPEQKALVTALSLISILTYVRATRESNHELRNIILIDEVHALLGQGEGVTQEEKSLNNTMAQLLINIITEMRAYGVGVIFSDQSPSRVGGCMLDNVDNLFSFRLSGEEAELLRSHMGASDSLSSCLPRIAAGEFFLKNQHLRDPLAIRAEYDPKEAQSPHPSDAQIAAAQRGYLAAHAKEYCPFSQCGSAGCRFCSVAIREEAHKYAVQIYTERQSHLQSPDKIAAHILKIPEVMSARLGDSFGKNRDKLCLCIAVHLLRLCSLEKGITLSDSAVSKLLRHMQAEKKSLSGGEGNELS